MALRFEFEKFVLVDFAKHLSAATVARGQMDFVFVGLKRGVGVVVVADVVIAVVMQGAVAMQLAFVQKILFHADAAGFSAVGVRFAGCKGVAAGFGVGSDALFIALPNLATNLAHQIQALRGAKLLHKVVNLQDVLV